MNAEKIIEAVELGSRAINKSEYDGGFPVRASALGGCRRRMGLGLERREAKPPTGAGARTLMAGNDQGRILASALAFSLERDGFQVDMEYEVMVPLRMPSELDLAPLFAEWEDVGIDISHGEKYLMIPGHIDALVHPISSSPFLIDFKTKHSYGIKLLPDEGPDDQYVAQVMAYMDGLRWRGIEIDTAFLVYSKRDDLSLRKDWIFKIDYNDPMSRNILENAKADARAAIVAHVKGEVVTTNIPIGPDGKLHWRCNYCPFSPQGERCFPDMTLSNSGTEDRPRWSALLPLAETEG